MLGNKSAPENLARFLIQRVESAASKVGLTDKTLVIAVSGGPDSTALLHLLAKVKTTLNLQLHVAYLDHGLRAESKQESEFVASESNALNIPFTIGHSDTWHHRHIYHRSNEAAAREIRYSFLDEVAKSIGANTVATGHTLDDQAETVLFHMIRGTGLYGLRGMIPISQYQSGNGSDLFIFRPLLSTTHAETQAYCSFLGIRPCLDKSNLLTDIPRNFLRIEVLPQLAILNPKVKEALIRLSHSADMNLSFIEEQAEMVWRNITTSISNGILLNRQLLIEQSPAIQSHILRKAYTTLSGSPQGLEQFHFDEILNYSKGHAGREMSLRNGIHLTIERKYIKLTKGNGPNVKQHTSSEIHPLVIPGISKIFRDPMLDHPVAIWKISAELMNPPVSIQKDQFVADLDYDAMGSSISIRTRLPGDRFQPLGVQSFARGKKLQDFFVNLGIPKDQRDLVPIVVTSKGIAWVIGWRIAHWARVTPNTKSILRLQFSNRI